MGLEIVTQRKVAVLKSPDVDRWALAHFRTQCRGNQEGWRCSLNQRNKWQRKWCLTKNRCPSTPVYPFRLPAFLNSRLNSIYQKFYLAVITRKCQRVFATKLSFSCRKSTAVVKAEARCLSPAAPTPWCDFARLLWITRLQARAS